MSRKSKRRPTELDETARKFAARLHESTKHEDPQASARRAAREQAVTKALLEHLAKRKK